MYKFDYKFLCWLRSQPTAAIRKLIVKKKIFVLGDSRTGTTTLHKFIKAAGLKSVHYFFKESGVTEPAHVDYEGNWKRLKTYIDTSGYDCFTDYPTRTFYKDLIREYPDAYFILSVRKDIETWRRSMKGFFEKFNLSLDLDNLTNAHITINDECEQLCADLGVKFCNISIDDDAAVNGKILSEFLELDQVRSLGWENRTDAYDNSMWSTRITLYNTTATDFLTYVKLITSPSEAMLSEYGWFFLINDNSEFMDYCFGDLAWAQDKVDRARSTLRERHVALDQQNISYLKFAIPEKPIVYSEFLPKIFADKPLSLARPAVQIVDPELDFYSYPEELLRDAKSYGTLYFRGDSRINWLGSYIVYHHIIEKMNAHLVTTKRGKQIPPILLNELQPILASFGGDLYSKMDAEARSICQGALKSFYLGKNIEHLVRYKLFDETRNSKSIPVEDDYITHLGDHETLRFKAEGNTLPKAVIFHDSSSDFTIDLLAELFSESLFIRHKGNVYDDVIEREKPDIVLHLMAERFMSNYSSSPAFSTLGLNTISDA
jgi:Sulfotransferase domain